MKRHVETMTRGVCRVLAVLAATLLMLPAASLAQNADWTIGDVFAAVQAGGNNVYQVFQPGNSTPIQTIMGEPGGGVLAACTFDDVYRLFGLDFGNTQILKFVTDDLSSIVPLGQAPLAINLPTAVPTIDQTIPGGTTTNGAVGPSNFRQSRSIAFDAAGNYYVGYANTSASLHTGGVEFYSHDGTLQNFFSPTPENNGAEWLDLAGASAAGARTIVYTSEGTKIYILDTSGVAPGTNPAAATLYSDLAVDFSGKFSGKLFQIRVLPGGGDFAANGVLVANQGNVVWVQSSCTNATGGTRCTAKNAVAFTKFTGENNLEFVSLDPNNPIGIKNGVVASGLFWAGDATTNDVMSYNVAKNKVVPGSTFTAGNPNTLGGICVHGSFSPAQPTSTPLGSPTLTTLANGNTVAFTTLSGATLTATLCGPPTALNQCANLSTNVTVTLRETLVNKTVGRSDKTLYSLNPGSPLSIAMFCSANPALCPVPPTIPVDCSTSTCTVPGSIDCDTSLTAGLGADLCEAFEFEAVPNTGFSTNLQLTPNPAGLANDRFVLNSGLEITDDTDTSGTKTTGLRSCVYTINQQGFGGTGAFVCGNSFVSPTDGTIFSRGKFATITFSFLASTGNTCDAKTTPTNLIPILLIVEKEPAPNKGAAPAPNPIAVQVTGGSNQTIPEPLMKLSGNTWQAQVKISNMEPDDYTATMIDLSGQVASITVSFTITK